MSLLIVVFDTIKQLSFELCMYAAILLTISIDSSGDIFIKIGLVNSNDISLCSIESI